MATLKDLQAQVRSYIYSTFPLLRPLEDQMTVTNVGTPVTHQLFTPRYHTESWAVGDIAEIKADEELIYLVEKEGNGFRVIRAYNNTTVAEIATGRMINVVKNPRFTAQTINFGIDTIIGELERKGVYRLETAIFRPNTLTQPSLTGLMEILALYYFDEGDRVCPLPFRQVTQYVSENEDFDHISPIRARYGQERTYYMTYKKRIRKPEDLMERQVGIVPVGVAAELLSGQIIPSLQDPGRRADQTITPGQEARDVQQLSLTYERRVREESQVLKTEAKQVPSNTATDYWRTRNP